MNQTAKTIDVPLEVMLQNAVSSMHSVGPRSEIGRAPDS